MSLQVSLLTKFRIEANDVIIIPDATRTPRDETKEQFEAVVASVPGKKLSTASSSSSSSSSSSGSSCGFIIPEEELLANKQKTYFHLRISEVRFSGVGDLPLRPGGEGEQLLGLPDRDDLAGGQEGPGTSPPPSFLSPGSSSPLHGLAGHADEGPASGPHGPRQPGVCPHLLLLG